MNTELETYLETLSARLSALPPARREDEMREVRGHLEALAASYRAQGHDEGEASRLAIRRFGQAERIGREINGVEVQRRTGRFGATLMPMLMQWSVSATLTFGLFSLANDKPSDFPYQTVDKALLALALASAGVCVSRLIEKRKARA